MATAIAHLRCLRHAGKRQVSRRAASGACTCPACHRCEVAGSIRRGKETPKDIELVCIPELYTEEHVDLFGHPYATEHRNRLFDRLPVVRAARVREVRAAWAEAVQPEMRARLEALSVEGRPL